MSNYDGKNGSAYQRSEGFGSLYDQPRHKELAQREKILSQAVEGQDENNQPEATYQINNKNYFDTEEDSKCIK